MTAELLEIFKRKRLSSCETWIISSLVNMHCPLVIKYFFLVFSQCSVLVFSFCGFLLFRVFFGLGSSSSPQSFLLGFFPMAEIIYLNIRRMKGKQHKAWSKYSQPIFHSFIQLISSQIILLNIQESDRYVGWKYCSEKGRLERMRRIHSSS